MHAIPPLPEGWPYEARPSHPELQARRDWTVPGQPGCWEMRTTEPPPDLAAEPLAGAFGRGGVQVVGDWVVRPYRRGGLMRHVNDRTYPSTARFQREYAVHEALWRAGLPTVEPLGYGFRRAGLGWQGLCFTRRSEGRPWPRDWDAGQAVLPAVMALLEALVRWRLWAPDLNATNFLLAEDGQVLALDWDRACWLPRAEDLGPRYAARLRRSLARLAAPDPVREAFEASLPPAWRTRP